MGNLNNYQLPRNDSANKWLAWFCRNNKVISYLEIGTALGGSAISVASEGILVKSIDIDGCEQARNNVKKEGVSHLITFETGDSKKLLEKEKDNSWSFVYVDGDHTREGARHDIKQAIRIATKFVGVHDVDNPRTKIVKSEFFKIAENFKYKIIKSNVASLGIGLIYL